MVLPDGTKYQLKDKATENDDPNRRLPTPPCPRSGEIRDYLFVTRDQLAWDSFHFQISEHILFAYIKRQGGLLLTPEESRDFLIVCNNNDVMLL